VVLRVLPQQQQMEVLHGLWRTCDRAMVVVENGHVHCYGRFV
jgi:hypothetical protein